MVATYTNLICEEAPQQLYILMIHASSLQKTEIHKIF